MKNIFVASIILACFVSFTACSKDTGTNSSLQVQPTSKIVLEEKVETFLSAPREASSKVFVVDESNNETYTDLKNSMSALYSVRVFSDGEIYTDEVNVQVDLSNLESDRDQCGKNMLKKVMPSKYANQFKFYSTDTEYYASFGEDSASSGVSGYTFNFKRVFEGRVVRNNANYLSIDTDAKGNVKSLGVALQHFKPTTESVVTDANAEENIATLDSAIRADFDSINVVTECCSVKKEKVTGVKVTSVAEAYCVLEHEHEQKLLPCVSYVADISVDEGQYNTVAVVDVPHSRTSWNGYEKGDKPFVFSPYRH